MQAFTFGYEFPTLGGMKHKPATLADVASHAGVSTATVSRCLNDTDKVVDATRVRVMQAVQALGYAPNYAAQVMAAGRTRTIGAVIPTMANAIFAEALDAFQTALGAEGYTLLVATSNYDPIQEEAQIKTLVARGAEALLLVGHDRGAEVMDFLASRNVPAVLAWSYLSNSVQAAVGFDNCAAMQQVVDHLVGLGHRRLAMITAPSAGNDRVQQRIAGVHMAAERYGIAPADIAHETVPYDMEQAVQALARLMGGDHPPTAILCSNDVQAAGAVAQASQMGLDVPGELSITGFDDLALARAIHPALTTIQVPHQAMGQGAAKMVLDMLSGQPAQPVLLPTPLIIRGTTGPAE